MSYTHQNCIAPLSHEQGFLVTFINCSHSIAGKLMTHMKCETTPPGGVRDRICKMMAYLGLRSVLGAIAP